MTKLPGDTPSAKTLPERKQKEAKMGREVKRGTREKRRNGENIRRRSKEVFVVLKEL